MDQFLNLPFVRAFLKMLANYSDFKGRTSREDFWWAILGNYILTWVLNFILRFLGTPGSILAFLVSLALLIPGLAIWTRRLHDINKSGWLQLLAITVVGCIPLIIWATKEGDEGDNQYGPNPKYVG